MKFTLDIDMSNAAFERYADDERDVSEVAAILRRLANTLDLDVVILTDKSTGTLRDSNGNTVGDWTVTP
jgi:hypothetical protein